MDLATQIALSKLNMVACQEKQLICAQLIAIHKLQLLWPANRKKDLLQQQHEGCAGGTQLLSACCG